MGASSLVTVDPQSASPLFNCIPAEIRNHIFELALTAFDDKTKPYRQNAYYCRPGHRYAQKIDTNLLLTCRRILSETQDLPASINEYTLWYWRGPPDVRENEISLENSRSALMGRRGLEKIHVFAQQFWLESYNRGPIRGFNAFTSVWKYTFATHLKITIRHSDWWWWEYGAQLALDPKRAGRPAADDYSMPSSSFAEGSWGSEFQNLIGLQSFELELETFEEKKDELDSIVSRASDWQFPLDGGHVLVLDHPKTRRMGWIEVELGAQCITESSPQEQTPKGLDTAPITARERLIKAGVNFDDADARPGVFEKNCLTYYIVTLTWRSRAI